MPTAQARSDAEKTEEKPGALGVSVVNACDANAEGLGDIMRVHSGNRTISGGAMKRQQPDDEGKEKGTTYFLGQLNQIYEETSAKSSRNVGEMDEEERLVFMARMLRILQEEDEIEVLAYVEQVQDEVGITEDTVRDAIRDLLFAGLVALDDGKIRLTGSGREMLSAA